MRIVCMLHKVDDNQRLIPVDVPFGGQLVVHDERVPCLHYMAPKEPHVLFRHSIPCQRMFAAYRICADIAGVLTCQYRGT